MNYLNSYGDYSVIAQRHQRQQREGEEHDRVARSEVASSGPRWTGHLTGLLHHVRDDATHEVRLGLPQHSHQVGELLLEGTNATTKTTQQHMHTDIGET